MGCPSSSTMVSLCQCKWNIYFFSVMLRLALVLCLLPYIPRIDNFFFLFGGNRQFFFSVLSLVSKVESFSYVLLSLNHRSLMRVMER